MKKLFILMLAGAMVLAFTMPASAVEHIFGGYWRTRAFMQRDFSGDDTQTADITRVDNRTRLYYTAQFSDTFKFVNKFEFNSTWGDDDGGDIGADGNTFRVKNSYADFTTGNFRTTLGIQGYAIGRGFVFDDDMSGLVVRYEAPWGRLPFFWIKSTEGGTGTESVDQDVDIIGLKPVIKVSDAVTLTPHLTWWYSNDGSQFDATLDEISLYYLGIDADITMDQWSFWISGIWNGGSVDDISSGTAVTQDREAYLVAGGAKTTLGPVGLHGQIIYASGDNSADDKDKAYSVPNGDSYYWAEILGQGTFDAGVSNGSPGNHPSNLAAGNFGLTYTLLEDLKLTGDFWYAAYPKSIGGNDVLGTELDFKATYKVMDNLNLDLVAAYLFAGDATNAGATKDKDPYELGARLSLSF